MGRDPWAGRDRGRAIPRRPDRLSILPRRGAPVQGRPGPGDLATSGDRRQSLVSVEGPDRCDKSPWPGPVPAARISRTWNVKIAADLADEMVVNLAVTRDRRPPTVGGVPPSGVVRPFADQPTAVELEVGQHLVPFHAERLTSS